MSGTLVAHYVDGSPGTRLAWLLGRRRDRDSDVGPYAPIVAHISGPADFVRRTAGDLPPGPAQAEAIVARLRRTGVPVETGEPVAFSSVAELIDFSRSRGASSVETVRADPSLLPDLQIGSWFRARWQLRLARRAARRIPENVLRRLAGRDVRTLELALELVFWEGVRSAATESELQRLTRSSYVAFYYHRIAGTSPDDRLDVPPAAFAAQLRLLRLLRFHALDPEEMLAFHGRSESLLPRRSYVLTADDAFRDAVEAFAQVGAHRPQMFAPTQRLGERLPWADAETASWDELSWAAAQGVRVGSHTRTHRRLTELGAGELEEELVGSLRDLGDLPGAIPVLAYPHSEHDRRVRAAAAAAGYSAAYTTSPGRNGAGSDAFHLSRIGVKPWDSRVSFLWKAMTGEPLPKAWERWRQLLIRLSAARRARRA